MIVGYPPLDEVVDELEYLHFLEAYETQGLISSKKKD
jgi:hypothetical protein